MKIFQKDFYNKISFEKDIAIHRKKLNESIHSKNILVVGGAGTIGSNYIKQILNFKPSKIVVVDINENALAELTRDLRSSKLLDFNPEYITYPVNLLSHTFDKIFYSDKWHVLANFSAHKHVRSEKDKISVEALIINNVYGAIKLLNLCEKKPPKFFFSVSTDKAADPVNIMGASKSLMEKLIISKKDKIRVSTARFANVAFSNGSLLEGFVNRINKKQPLSCPEDIKRFFVTPEQSGQICLLATFLGKSGSIFFPKLDYRKDQIFFKEIAVDFLKGNGFSPYPVGSEKEAKEYDFDNNNLNYPIYFFKTKTSGEKTFEQFFTDEEDFEINTYHSLGTINTPEIKISVENVKSDFQSLFSSENFEKIDVVKLINKYVPNFNHIETNKHLDQKM